MHTYISAKIIQYNGGEFVGTIDQFLYVAMSISIHLSYHIMRIREALPICTGDQSQSPIMLSSSAKNSTLISNCQHLTLHHWHRNQRGWVIAHLMFLLHIERLTIYNKMFFVSKSLVYIYKMYYLMQAVINL